MEGMRLNMVKPYRLPKVKIPKTKSEWIWDMIGIGFYISSTIYLLIVWNQIPDQVPGHFNALGEADRWGPKWDLWLFPIMGALLLISLQIVEKFPEIYNYPKRINETNFKQFYLLGRQLINQLKNLSLIIFAILSFEMIWVAQGKIDGLGAWFLPFVFIIVFLPIGIYILKQRKIK